MSDEQKRETIRQLRASALEIVCDLRDARPGDSAAQTLVLVLRDMLGKAEELTAG